ncbi:hypothetical protein CYMTET_53093, partial [Cymbomonas tetramitiformis]
MEGDIIPQSDEDILILGVGPSGSSFVSGIKVNELYSSAVKCLSLVVGAKSASTASEAQKGDLQANIACHVEDFLPHLSQANTLMLVMTGVEGNPSTPSGAVAAELIKHAAKRGLLTAAIVSQPFSFQGAKSVQAAQDTAAMLQEAVDMCVIVDTDDLMRPGAATITAESATVLAQQALQ